MELKWLEDFLALAELRNFTQAAEIRFVTQPAFSRRIRSLERWVGTSLIDRSTYPVTLTPAGEEFLESAREYVEGILSVRSDLHSRFTRDGAALVWIMPGSLSATFFPRWWRRYAPMFPKLPIKILSQKLLDATSSLERGACHLMVFYRHSTMPPSLEPDRFEGVEIGTEQLIPVSAPDDSGGPKYRLPSTLGGIPYVHPGPGTWIFRVVHEILERNQSTGALDPVYENANADSLRAEALAGRGLAWLPSRLVQPQLGAGSLVRAGDDDWAESVGIWLYRSKEDRHAAVPKLWQAVTAKAELE